MHKCLYILFALLLQSCAPSLHSIGVQKSSIPKVRAIFKALDPAFSDKVPPYQERLDDALDKAAKNNHSFIPVFSTDSITKADYEIVALIDSVYLVSEEYQKKQVKVIKSLKVSRDSMNASISREESKSPIVGPGSGVFLVDEIAVAVTNHEIDGELIKPRITGRVEVESNGKGSPVWKKAFDIHDKYDRFVTYSEQLDMIFRLLIGNMRFVYRTPFLCERQ